MLNGVFQKPYIVKDGRGAVKKKEDEETSKSSSQTQREESSNTNSRSKGLQYTEQNKNKSQNSYSNRKNEAVADWQTMRSQIQGQIAQRKAASSVQSTASIETTAAVQAASSATARSASINIAQILKDFNNTAIAIGTPDDLKEEVDGYLSLVEKQVTKENPNTKLVKSNLKNASTILDNYISQTLNKNSKVVENWVDALFLQQIDFNYNENDINTQFLVKFPEGTIQRTEKAAEKSAVDESVTEITDTEIATDSKVESIIPQDKELKSLFIQSKKLAYANEPEQAVLKFQEALERADEVDDTETKAKIYYEVGKIYDEHSYVRQALTSYNKAIENTTDNNVKTKAHYSMAQIYDETNQITTALDHYFNSVSFAGEAENLNAQSVSLTRMGNIYSDMYEQDSFDFYNAAEDLVQQTDNSKVKGFVYSGMAKAYEKFGEPQSALNSYSKAVQYYTDAESPLKTAQNYRAAAEVMLEYNNSSKAKGLLTKAQNYARQTDDINLMNEIEESLNALL